MQKVLVGINNYAECVTPHHFVDLIGPRRAKTTALKNASKHRPRINHRLGTYMGSLERGAGPLWAQEGYPSWLPAEGCANEKESKCVICLCLSNVELRLNESTPRPRCSAASTSFSTRLEVLLFRHAPRSTHLFFILSSSICASRHQSQ